LEISVRCFAKLNLFLKVYGKRPDGFHDIISVMQSIDLVDTISIIETNSGGIEISCSRPGVPLDSTNLVWKAAEALSRDAGHPISGLRITINKDIPVMGGLGGGSADAAGTLTALAKLWKLDFDESVLFKLAGKLGSDVPFCLLGGTSLAFGRGEMLEPSPTGLADRAADPGAFLIIAPPIQVETRAAYELLDKSREKEARKWGSMWEEQEEVRTIWNTAIMEGSFPMFFANDFEKPVLDADPKLASIYSNLRNSAGHAALSGSGSSMFAYFPVSTHAINVAESYTPVHEESAIVAHPVNHGVEIEG
jgi:4-diphosphocytidyl-2-C-methyl-D-erythritol kinase